MNRIDDIDVMRLRFAVRNGWSIHRAAKLAGMNCGHAACIVRGIYRRQPRDVDQLARDLGLAGE